MAKFIAILRGINVSGKNKIAMKNLSALFVKMGFKEIKTYIQSGNVVFESVSIANLAGKIEKAIQEEMGLQVPVIVLRPEYLKNTLKQNPFLLMKGVDEERIYFTFLATEPDKERLKTLLSLDFPPDQVLAGDQVIYLYCPVSYGNSKWSNNFVESKLKVLATTRNLKTVRALCKMLD